MYLSYFNPHPRTEGDKTVRVLYIDDFFISTHTLARRVTDDSCRKNAENINFNPHPRTEGDDWRAETTNRSRISTHTLARRVTAAENIKRQKQEFQPTPSHGG